MRTPDRSSLASAGAKRLYLRVVPSATRWRVLVEDTERRQAGEFDTKEDAVQGGLKVARVAASFLNAGVYVRVERRDGNLDDLIFVKVPREHAA